MSWTQSQITAGLLALFATSGPLAKIIGRVFHIESDFVNDIMSLFTLATPLIAGYVYVRLASPANQVAAVSELPPVQQHEALSNTTDAAKVLIAKGVEGVATVVIKDSTNGALGALANSPSQPDIVTESQNETDAKKGTKTP